MLLQEVFSPTPPGESFGPAFRLQISCSPLKSLPPSSGMRLGSILSMYLFHFGYVSCTRFLRRVRSILVGIFLWTTFDSKGKQVSSDENVAICTMCPYVSVYQYVGAFVFGKFIDRIYVYLYTREKYSEKVRFK